MALYAWSLADRTLDVTPRLAVTGGKKFNGSAVALVPGARSLLLVAGPQATRCSPATHPDGGPATSGRVDRREEAAGDLPGFAVAVPEQRDEPRYLGTLAAHLAPEHLLILCIPERMVVRRALEHACEVSPPATILARTHSCEHRQVLQGKGVHEAVVGHMELTLELGRRTLERFGVARDEVKRSLG